MAKILSISFIFIFCTNINVFANSNVLKIPLQTALISLDPSHIQDAPSLFVSRQINCQLVRSKGSIYQMEAAESIKYISPLEIMVKIKDSASFHDGTPVTAKDVVSSFDYIKKSRNVLRNMFLWVNEVVIVNDKTIVFKLKKPIPQFIKVLSSSHNAIFKNDFLKSARRNDALWRNPQGCGGYKVAEFNGSQIKLTPVRGGMQVVFFINKDNILTADTIDQYDIFSLNIDGFTDKMNQFNRIEVFDPYQIFIGLNADYLPWHNKSARCSFLAKLNRDKLVDSYADFGELANDFLPKGMLGYNNSEEYFSSIELKYKKTKSPELHNFCLAYLTVSIPHKYLTDYSKIIQQVYANIVIKPIKDSRQFGLKFRELNCDALVFALKSNNLDGYEYLDIFANNDANFSGIFDKELVKRIKSSQEIVNPHERVLEYRKLIQHIENMCIIRPLITTPMRTIYIHKSLQAPDIGLGSFNDYYLGNVRRI